MLYRTISKSLLFVAVGVVLSGVGLAYADRAADKRAAANSKLNSKERIAACERLLAIKELSDTERAWALITRGGRHRSMKKYDLALADFAQAQKLDPNNPRVHRYRGSLHFARRKYKQADAEFSRALELAPRNSWSWYMRARTRGRLRKYDESLKDYGQALELKPRYSSAYGGRAWVHLRLKNYDKAVKDCDGAIAISPYYASPYTVRGNAYALLGKTDLAIHDHAIARSLDPNLDDPKRNLKRLVTKAKVSGSTTRPADFQQPEKGLTISYLMTVGVTPPKQDEMEEAIGGLVAFFKKKRVPPPKTKIFVVREVTAGKGDTTTIKPAKKYPGIDKKRMPAGTIDYYRTLFPAALPMGNSGMSLTIEFDKPPLKDIWPLKVGNKSSGSGKYVFIGPDPLTPPAKFLGCKKPGDKITLGTVKWTGQVLQSQKVTVPAGVFDTFVIRVEESAEIVMLGQSKKRDTVLTWWYSPSVRWWVKRTQQTGENLAVNEAETVKP